MAAALLVLLLAVATAEGADHTVGGSSGWNLGVNYASWAAGETFKAGDNLVFNYGGTHSVMEVTKAGYDACSTSNGINTYTSGSDTVPLPAAGNKYYICPTTGHCQGGMKLAVVVAAGSGASPPTPPSTPSTPATPGSPPTNSPGSPPTTPSGSTPSTPPPPPPQNGAAATAATLSHTLLGSAVVLVAMFRYI